MRVHGASIRDKLNPILHSSFGFHVATPSPIKPQEHILDHMGSTELTANLLRATQTEEKLRRENVRNKDRANEIHKDAGRKVRQTIRELGGTMPDKLPADESIKKVESREKRRLKVEPKRQLQNPPA
jgi:DNA-damage-inducible protein D